MNPGIAKKPVLFLLLCLLTPGDIYSTQLEPLTDTSSSTFSLPDLNGKIHTLQDYRGKVVLVNFWASWCLPCLREMPSMKRLADSLNDQDFVILTLNISDPAIRIIEVLKSLQLDMTVLLDRDGKTFTTWHGEVLPTSYLLDHTGKIHYRIAGPTEWDDADTVSKVKQLIESR